MDAVSFMGFTNWCEGQPDFSHGQESCGHYSVSSADSCWNDVSCSTEMCYVCEIDRS